MAYIPLKLPAGISSDGTDFENQGRWLDGNLVRWVSGSLRPMGGWTLRNAEVQASLLKYGDYDPTAINDDTNPAYSGATTTGVGYGNKYYGGQTAMNEPPRSMLAWLDNSYNSRIVLGSANILYSVTHAGEQYDITPPILSLARIDADTNQAYGGWLYGYGYYGTRRPDVGQILEATTWSLDTWGEYLVACASTDGTIFEWQLDTGIDPSPIPNAPTNAKGIIVTEERFIFALGADDTSISGNPRKIMWCDREDNTVWTPSATNEAGDIELQTGGRIMCALRVRGRTLILTDEDAHLATYQGPPYVYGFERAGTSCGCIGRKAATQVREGAFWMGHGAFFTFDGSSTVKIPCSVTDHVFQNMNYNQISKVYCVHNAAQAEVWWFYPSQSSLENDSYVIYDYVDNYWNVGKIRRTCGIDAGVYDYPVWADEKGNLYQHEVGFFYEDASNEYSYEQFVESSSITLGNGDQVMKVTQLVPDEKTQGEVTAKFKTRFHPNDTERTYGSYAMGNPTSVRFTGRQIRMRIESDSNEDWRVGIMRVDAEPGGNR
jgi:hypothetical protein